MLSQITICDRHKQDRHNNWGWGAGGGLRAWKPTGLTLVGGLEQWEEPAAGGQGFN